MYFAKENMDMARKKRLNQAILIGIFIILNLIFITLSICVGGVSERLLINILAVLSIFQLVYSLGFLTYSQGSLVSYSAVFLIFSFITHLSQYFFFNGSRNILYSALLKQGYYADKVLLITIEYIFCCHFLLITGMMVNCFAKSNVFDNYCQYSSGGMQNSILRKDSNSTIFIGRVLVLIGIVPKIYYSLQKVRLFLAGSYLDTYSLTIPGYIAFISNLTEYGLLAIIISKLSQNRRIAGEALLFLIIELLGMVSGNRGYATISLLMLMFILITFHAKHVERSKLLLYLVIGYLLVVGLTIIGRFRSVPDRSFANILSYLKEVDVFQPLVLILVELGGTFTSVANSLMFFPAYVPFRYGLNYVVGFLTIFPDIFNLSPLINGEMFFPQRYPNNYGAFAGGSYIGESYYSFGWAGIFLFLLVGYLIEQIDVSYRKAMATSHELKAVMLLPLMFNCLWWVRDYFGSMVRDIVWMNLILLILSYFVYLFENKDIKRREAGAES